MQVNFNNQNTNPVAMGTKIPLSEYKGVILKLTAGDKKKIAEIQKDRTNTEIELYKLLNFFKRNKICPDYSIRIDKLSAHINSCNREIAAIKRQRLEKQIAKMNKLDVKA